MQAVTRAELAEIIGEKSLADGDGRNLARQIAAYLASQARPVDLGSLMRDVMQYRLEHGYVEARAVSAHELSQEVLDDITALLKERYPAAKHIQIDSVIDDSVVGGVRIELPRETLDLSVRSKLNMFKRLVAQEGV